MGPRHGGGDFLGETHAELVVACSLASMFVAHQPAFQQEKLLMVKILLCKHKHRQGGLQCFQKRNKQRNVVATITGDRVPRGVDILEHP